MQDVFLPASIGLYLERSAVVLYNAHATHWRMLIAAASLLAI
jgi:hypothetical protein